MLAGIAKKDITPPYPMLMMGYGDREHSSSGVHDNLMIYVLYVEGADGSPWCWVSADLCVIGFETAIALKERISETVGLDSSRILIQGTHTHSGPDTLNLHAGESEEEKQYFNLLVRQMSEGILEAEKAKQNIRIVLRQGIGSIGINRRGLKKPVDNRLFFLSFLQANDVVLANIMYYSCHLTTLGVDNYLFSSDWIGPVRDWFEKEYSSPFMFTQGAEGNTDPYTRGVLNMSDPRQAEGIPIEEMCRVSSIMVENIKKVIIKQPIFEFDKLEFHKFSISLPLRYGGLTLEEFDEKILKWKILFAEFLKIKPSMVPEDQSINRLVKKYIASHEIEPEISEYYVAQQFEYTQFIWAYKNNSTRINIGKGTISVPITIIEGDVIAFVVIPAEPLMTLNLVIKGKYKQKIVLFCGLGDGYAGYLPHSENYLESDYSSLYETVSTIFARDAASILIDFIGRKLVD